VNFRSLLDASQRHIAAVPGEMRGDGRADTAQPAEDNGGL
jgi:hypothetical protein